MTVLKEPTPTRPASSQHRSSHSAIASSLPAKSRIHAHSLSAGSLNPAHRVGRRKSMSSTSKAAIPRGPAFSAHTAMPSSLPSNNPLYNPISETAITDGPSLGSMPETEKGNNKARSRRASEGSHLKSNAKRVISGGELKCESCGKNYKHSSCLTKHLWEHTPEWQYTSKLLISKHQQVQLLEAASVLVAMNAEGESSKDSDHSSASPAASADSDLRDDELSSTDTTPPPHLGDLSGSYSTSRSNYGRSKRFSTNSSAYSQSYQSTSVFSDGSHHLSHYRQWSNDGRPTTSGTSVAGSYYEDEDSQDLAAAVGLLSCSYGTPKTNPTGMGADVPPVPPLPARFLGMKSESISGSTTTVTAHQSSIRGGSYISHIPENKDVDMGNESSEEDDFEQPTTGRNYRMDDDDDGVFGRMD